MQWDDARIFLAFAREGSFGAAAKRLGVQHSTISRRIHTLEKDLGTPLTERSATGYVLTKEGEEFKRSAMRIEKEILDFEAASAGKDEEIAGRLRVTAIANMASSILMPLFASFTETIPISNSALRLPMILFGLPIAMQTWLFGKPIRHRIR